MAGVVWSNEAISATGNPQRESRRHFAARVADPNAALGLRVNLGLDGLNVLVYASFLTLAASRLRGRRSPCLYGSLK